MLVDRLDVDEEVENAGEELVAFGESLTPVDVSLERRKMRLLKPLDARRIVETRQV